MGGEISGTMSNRCTAPGNWCRSHISLSKLEVGVKTALVANGELGRCTLAHIQGGFQRGRVKSEQTGRQVEVLDNNRVCHYRDVLRYWSIATTFSRGERVQAVWREQVVKTIVQSRIVRSGNGYGGIADVIRHYCTRQARPAIGIVHGSNHQASGQGLTRGRAHNDVVYVVPRVGDRRIGF